MSPYPTRRSVLKGAGALATLPALGWSGACGTTPRRRPNILFLITDQHRYDVAGFAGDRLAVTPALDGLAAAGATFTEAYCQSPLCVPARQSLVTGQRAFQHGTYGNVLQFPEDQRTIVRHLADEGYQTAMIGKAHVNTAGFAYVLNKGAMYGEFKRANPDARRPGEGLPEESSAPYTPAIWAANPLTMGPGEGPVHYMEHDVVEHSKRWLADRDPERPFFLWASFVRPHPPRFPPEEWCARFRDVQIPNWGPAGEAEEREMFVFVRDMRRVLGLDRATAADVLGLVRSYYASVAFSDHCIGELLAALDALDLAGDTLVVYTSDHGEMLGQHGLFGKFTLYEGATRVPLILRWPGHVPAGRRVEHVVEHLDLVRTMLELVRVPVPSHVEGRSLAPLLAGAPDADWEDLAVSEMYNGRANFAEAPRDSIGLMLREGRFKFVAYGGAERALFDIAEDPEERRNLARDPTFAGRVEAMQGRLEAMIPERVFVRAYKRR